MARGRRKKHFKFKPKKQTTYNILGLFLIGFSLLIWLSYFQSGSILIKINSAIVDKFGQMGGLFLPLILILISFLFFNIKTSFTRPNVTFGALLSYISLLSLTQNGYIGKQIWGNFSSSISDFGSFIILFGMFCIGLIVLFNTSIDEISKFISSSYKDLTKSITPLSAKINKKKEKTFAENLLSRPPAQFNTGSTYKKDSTVPKETENKTDKNTANDRNIKQTALTNISTFGTKVISNIPEDNQVWEFPPLSLLGISSGQKADRGDMKYHAQTIERTLESFGITARIVEYNLGPAVTQYALEIALGTKLSKITSLSNDLALAIAAPGGQIRIEAPIPGRNLVGIEVPNKSLEYVTLKHMLGSDSLKRGKDKLLVALGLDVSGRPIHANIAKMPHVLIAGTTGSGKSVLINSWISSILFRASPSEVRLILVDPKRVELIGYNGIPHLLTPVIVEPDKILSALKWATQEMDKRYKLFSEVGVRNIDGYNELSGFQAIPYIVIFIDELADLMAYAPVEVEDSICRLAQMARATGIHLVVATQRPSVDVITGLIKANIPTRVAFSVSSMIDSRVIIDSPGAEKLLGRGDMLYIPPDQAKPTRIQGTFVSEQEVAKLVEFLKSKNQPVEYTKEITTISNIVKKTGAGNQTTDDGKDALFIDAVKVVCQYDRASASLLQRRLSIGYARAARIIDQLETEGVIGAGEGAKPRDVLIKDPSTYFSNNQTEENPSKDQSQNNL
jgi:DNA segregation ATPase FtsK/SpoIIIE, S-DNA-T family